MTTRLGATVSATDTQWAVDNDDILGSLGYPIRLVCESETIEVVGAAYRAFHDTERKLWTVRRGVDGTAPAAHTGGVAITSGAVTTGSDAAGIAAHEADTTNVHGIADTSVVGLVQRAVVNLTDAQVKALPTTPVTLVAAPGAGKFIQPLHAVFRLIWTADYSNIDATCYIGVKLPGGELLLPLRQSVSSAVSGLLAGGGPDGSIAVSPAKFAAAGAYVASGFSGVSGFYDSDLENFPLTIYTSNGAAGNFTDGNAANVLRVTVYYVVVDL